MFQLRVRTLPSSATVVVPELPAPCGRAPASHSAILASAHLPPAHLRGGRRRFKTSSRVLKAIESFICADMER